MFFGEFAIFLVVLVVFCQNLVFSCYFGGFLVKLVCFLCFLLTSWCLVVLDFAFWCLGLLLCGFGRSRVWYCCMVCIVRNVLW